MISAHSRGQQIEAQRRALMTSVDETSHGIAQYDRRLTSKYRERDSKVLLFNRSRGVICRSVYAAPHEVEPPILWLV